MHLFSVPSRPYEALQIFWSLYRHMLSAQDQSQRAHKGMPLVWMSDSFRELGCPLHQLRFLMLTLAEDAVRGSGDVVPYSTGAYHRLVWTAFPDSEFRRYAIRFFELARVNPKVGMFPEALLQDVREPALCSISLEATRRPRWQSTGTARSLSHVMHAWLPHQNARADGLV
jgi:hypothetical protein